uniref:cathelicidin antimicrobial peptide n=1 Tax=Jaculus jaculus TaxID=51337 RepID=UPI001E1B3779|nr:cathelicidin antimicrobial peptide [Jaculus jaculus]
MAELWKAFVLVLGLAVVSCEANRRLRYEDIVAQALKFYNDGQRGKPLFRLLEATPPSTNSTTRILLDLRIKETVCISTQERQPQECDFREGGEERTCTGEFFRRRSLRILTLTCDRICAAESQVSLMSPLADSPEADAPLKAESTQLPPAIRNIYENAKYDIINNILRNF